MNNFKRALVLLVSGCLFACGGGSDNNNDSSNPPSSSSSSSSSAAVNSSAVSSASLISSSSVSSIGSASSVASSAGSIPATISSFIVVDQFGYLPSAQKIAVVRDPQIGYDAAENFTPGPIYQLVNTDTGEVAHSGAAQVWSGGTTHAASGDKAWWFDFSAITAQGNYTVVDVEGKVRSPGFKIHADVYKPVLKHAMRTFFYQRAGFAKTVPHAEAGWMDGPSHIGSCQDTSARLFQREGDVISGVAGTEKDLSGGWFDAGDYNKYTNWHANYLITLLHTYLENPAAWESDLDIPESGDEVPDIIDEIKWGFDWLNKMQNADGSVLSILGLAHASPPSAATGCSYYGPASTSATMSSAAAFAFGAKVFAEVGANLGDAELISYAAAMKTRAENAWSWANDNPDVRVNNNQGMYQGLGAGDQEVCANYLTIDDPEDRALEEQRCANQLQEKKINAAVYLFALTGETAFKTMAEEFINSNRLYWVSHWNENRISTFLYYADLPGATPTIADDIRADYINSMNTDDLLTGYRNNNSPYRAYMAPQDFTWGSNRSMSQRGTLFFNLSDLDDQNADDARNAALGYINYIHGVNPQAMAYLSNMGSVGAHSSVNEFYHSWFTNGSSLWDRVGESVYGPAPGFLVGGPNPQYDWDDVCKTINPNPGCGAAAPTPPKGQPPMKSYLDFNTSWPLNSWQITENHNDYQVAYIRLLSKFVE